MVKLFECTFERVEEICVDKMSLFTAIILSGNITARCTTDLSNDIVRQLKDSAKSFKYFLIALDEFTDSTDSTQVHLFIRGVSEALKITEELVTVRTMQDTVIGYEIFLNVKEIVSTLGFDFINLRGVTIDGGHNIFRTREYLTGNVYKAVSKTEVTPQITVNCIIHQQSLCGEYTPISEVMNVLIQIVNFI